MAGSISESGPFVIIELGRRVMRLGSGSARAIGGGRDRRVVKAAVVTAEVLEKRQLLSTVALWHFNESSGTTSSDSSGSGKTATLASGGGLAAGHAGSALRLSG